MTPTQGICIPFPAMRTKAVLLTSSTQRLGDLQIRPCARDVGIWREESISSGSMHRLASWVAAHKVTKV